MRPFVHVALFFLLIATSCAPSFAATSANVIASVTVLPSCNFALSINSLPSYTRIGSITMSYTVNTLPPSCTIDPLRGTFTITQVSNSNVMLTQSISSNNVGPTAQTNNVVFKTNTLTNTTYSAAVSLTYNGFTNSIANQFVLLNPQNLSIKSFGAPSSATVGSPITFVVNTLNFGQLASGTITLNLQISGPVSFNSVYSESSLSPGQSAIYSITIPNATQSAGTYYVNAYETYTVGNNINSSNTASLQYSVSSNPFNPGSGGGGVTTSSTSPITAIPSLQFTSAPIYTSVSSGGQALTSLGLKNTGGQPETVQLSIPKSFQNFISLSTSSLYILPNQTIGIQMFVNTNTTMPTGTYLIPLTVNLNSGGTTSTQTEYFTFDIYTPQSKNLEVISTLTMVNNTSSARGVVQIINPTTNEATKVTLQTLIPLAVARNTEDIVTSGLQANVTDPPGFYTITWQIPSIAAKSSIYGYYLINQPRSQKLLQSIQSVLAAPSVPTQSNLLKVVNIAFPTFYTDSTDDIQIFALYTGGTPQQISFTLTGPSGITIANASQNLQAIPNQLLSPDFTVTTGDQQGTYLLNLYIATDGFNTSYTLPLIVLNNPLPPSAAGKSKSPFPPVSLGTITLPFGGAGIIIIIIALVIYLLRRNLSKPRYRRETSEQLVRLREQIKRSEDE